MTKGDNNNSIDERFSVDKIVGKCKTTNKVVIKVTKTLFTTFILIPPYFSYGVQLSSTSNWKPK